MDARVFFLFWLPFQLTQKEAPFTDPIWAPILWEPSFARGTETTLHLPKGVVSPKSD